MPEFIAPLLPEYSIQIPQSVISLVGWLVWLVVLVGIAVRNRDRQFVLDRASLAWLALLSVLLLIFTPFLGVPIKTAGSVGAPHLMFLAALPWMAAGGLLGMVPSVLLAGLSGVLLAYLDTHSIFTPLFFMSIAVVFTLAIRQKQQGFLYRLLRIPPVAALAAGAVCSRSRSWACSLALRVTLPPVWCPRSTNFCRCICHWLGWRCWGVWAAWW